MKNQERYRQVKQIFTDADYVSIRPTFNAGPFKHLPVAYMKSQNISEEQLNQMVEEDEKENKEIEEAGFKPNFSGNF